MTTLEGGGSGAKLADGYEFRWTVLFGVVPVLSGEFDAITVEPPGLDGVGIEFCLEAADGRSEVHQVKRARSTRWTYRALLDERVVGAIKDHLAVAGRTFVFGSGTETAFLRQLTRTARKDLPLQVWLESAGGSDLAAERGEFTKAWGVDDETARAMFARIEPRTIDEPAVAQIVRDRLEDRLEGEGPDEILEALRTLLEERLNERVTAHELVLFLAGRGIRLRDTAASPAAAAQLRTRTQAFCDRVRALAPHGVALLRRAVEQEVLHLLNDGRVRVVALTGVGGAGKSTVCAAVAEKLLQAGAVVAALSVTDSDAFTADEAFATAFGAPLHRVLPAAAFQQKCVLILDQLDVLSLASGRGDPDTGPIERTLQRLQELNDLTLVVACRSHDLTHDPRLRSMLAAFAGPDGRGLREVQVGTFTGAEVDTALSRLAPALHGAGERLRALVRLPVNLRLLADLAADATRRDTVFDGTTLRSQSDLLRAYDAMHRRAMVGRLGAGTYQRVCAELARRMSGRSTLALPRIQAEGINADAVEALLSDGVLFPDDRHVRFIHPVYLSYVFAMDTLGAGLTASAVLEADELQDLPRRGQARMILALEREEDPQTYAHDLRRLVTSERIRPHVRFAVLEGLAEVGLATGAEVDLAVELAASPTVLAAAAQRLLSQPVFAARLRERGTSARSSPTSTTAPPAGEAQRLLGGN